MPFSIRLSGADERLLEAAAKRTSRTKSELAREGIREHCVRLAGGDASAFDLGKGLFGIGALARPRAPRRLSPTAGSPRG